MPGIRKKMGACVSRLNFLHLGSTKKSNPANESNNVEMIKNESMKPGPASHREDNDLPPLHPRGSLGRSSNQATPGVSTHQIQFALKEGKKVVRALYDFVSADNDVNTDYPDLNFQKGDVMEVIKEDGDWWLARNMLTGAHGYIPNTYVALENGIDLMEWFHGKISRKDCERLLVNVTFRAGTFLIRESESAQGSFSLSVLDVDALGQRSVKHYRIRDLDEGGCYITTRKRCQSLSELVDHYRKSSDGLCQALLYPCPKPKPVMADLSRGTRDHWEIDRKTLVLQEMLGSGNFGEVYRGVWNNKTPVAVKTLKTGMMEVSKFLEEAAIMKRLRHPRLVSLFAVCSQEEPYYIVTELCTGGSLLTLLRNDSGHTLIFPRLTDIAAQVKINPFQTSILSVAEGMRYVEGKNYIHRDLAARNILVTENCNVKIGDFGLARVINEDIYTPQPGAKFPIKWTAPEAATYGRFTIKSDVWAYGIFLVELLTYGQQPYPGMSNSEVLAQLEMGYRHPKPHQCPDELYDIMMSCWKKEPNERPTFDHLFNTMDDYSVATQSSYAESLQ